MKTIILIHGMRGTHHGLSQIADQLSSQNYKVITPDLPGSGTRAELENKTMDGYVEWLHSYINNLRLKQKPYIVGHSMGSMIVSHYLDKYPDQTQEKVIFMAPIFRTKFNQKFSNFSFGALNIFLHALTPNARYKFLKSKGLSYCISHYLTCDKSQQKRIDQLHYKYSGRFASAASITADIKLSMQTQTIIPPRKKILLIVGNKDKLTSLQMAQDCAKNKDINIKTVDNVGHLLNYEKPDDVSKIILDYLK